MPSLFPYPCPGPHGYLRQWHLGKGCSICILLVWRHICSLAPRWSGISCRMLGGRQERGGGLRASLKNRRVTGWEELVVKMPCHAGDYIWPCSQWCGISHCIKAGPRGASKRRAARAANLGAPWTVIGRVASHLESGGTCGRMERGKMRWRTCGAVIGSRYRQLV